MINKKERKGFALITVVLIAALVFMSIIGVVLKVVPEKAISVARTSSERALTVAETGISKVTVDLRNADLKNNVINPTDADHYLTPAIIAQIATVNVGTVISIPEKNYSTNPYTTYSVKIKKTVGEPWDPTVAGTSADETKIIIVTVYILGTVYKGSSTNSEVAARKAFKTEMQITYNKKTDLGTLGDPGTLGTGSVVWGYGLFSGANIIFDNGNAQSVDGNIFSDGDIYMGQPKKTRVKNSAAYAHRGIWENGGADKGKYVGQTEITFPTIHIDYYQDLATAFKTGQPPYNGTVITDPDTGEVLYTYPNTSSDSTSDSIVMAVVQSYLGTGASSSIDQIQTFYNDLKNRSGGFLSLNDTQWGSLWNNAKSIVYYIDSTAHVNGNFTAQGKISFNGDFMINGNASIYNDGGLAILVNGNIVKANGTAELHGLFYATGTFSGGGTFDVYGAIVTGGTINVGGTFNVYYRPVNMPTTGIDGTPPTPPTGAALTSSTVYSATQSESSWQQISYDKFLNPQ